MNLYYKGSLSLHFPWQHFHPLRQYPVHFVAACRSPVGVSGESVARERTLPEGEDTGGRGEAGTGSVNRREGGREERWRGRQGVKGFEGGKRGGAEGGGGSVHLHYSHPHTREGARMSVDGFTEVNRRLVFSLSQDGPRSGRLT